MDRKLETGTIHDWQETKLWKVLVDCEKPEAEDARKTLEDWMPEIQRILLYGGTSPTDFTLHDSQHAFRVAERMVDVIPVDVLQALSTYELSLLILSAYLHDIGMSPEQSLITMHYNYLLTGLPQALPQDSLDTFQHWLDEQEEEIQIPLAQGTPTPETLSKANLAITHYCRSRHVDWGEGWIEKNLTKSKLGTYTLWVNDLKILCRSHHEGYQELKQDRFDPKPVGSSALTVHLRYLASVLRVADILEFDPERTPDIILQHRDISPGSLIYWYKDHHVARLIEDGRLTIYANPHNARLHRAIELMIDDIENELQLIRKLDDEIHFKVSPNQGKELYHRWDIPPDIRRNISPLNDAYEYIYGAFRPNTQKMLQLLSGRELYNDDFVAIRELLQNAFDAVREQIAYERLGKDNPADPQWEDLFGKTHEVALSLEIQDDRVWIVCTDDGAGMSKAIITNYLLVSGNSHRSDIRSLDRLCKSSDFNLGRTGQFGIGVLSYFMIADQVQIYTKRSDLANDNESTGWFFETEGIGSFGELRKDHSWKKGTQVRLRLKKEIINKITQSQIKWVYKLFEEENDRYALDKDDFASVDLEKCDNSLTREQTGHVHSTDKLDYLLILVNSLENYLQQTLFHIPCKFILTSQYKKAHLVLNPGWTKEPTIWNRIVVKNLIPERNRYENLQDEFFSTRLQQQMIMEWSPYQHIPENIKESLFWDTRMLSLPNNIGICRISIPLFNLNTGKSLYFCDDYNDNGKISLHRISSEKSNRNESRQYLRRPLGKFYMSWKGMAVRVENENIRKYPSQIKGVFIEVDWQSNSAGIVSINREKITLSEAGREALDWLWSHLNQVFFDFAAANNNPLFSALGYLLGEKEELVDRNYWLYLDAPQSEDAVWGNIKFPLIDTGVAGRYNFLPDLAPIKWNGKTVQKLLTIILVDDEYFLFFGKFRTSWSFLGFHPDQIVSYKVIAKRFITGIWFDFPTSIMRRYFEGYKCPFPPDWQKYLCILQEDSIFWNSDHILSTVTDVNATEWARNTFGESLDPRPYRESLLENREKAAAWLLEIIKNAIDKDIQKIWDALVEHEQGFLNAIWQLIFSMSDKSSLDNSEISVIYNSISMLAIIKLSLTGFSREEISGQTNIERFFSVLDSEWKLEFVAPSESV